MLFRRILEHSRKLFLWIPAAFFLTSPGVFPPDSPPATLSDSILADDLKTHVSILASDSMEGRETGQPGQEKAAAYISGYFRKLGLEPAAVENNKKSYFQRFTLEVRKLAGGELTCGNNTYRLLQDFACTSMNIAPKRKDNLTVVFTGRGNPSDYRNLNVRGKAVMIYFTSGIMSIAKVVETGMQFGATDFFILYTKDRDAFNGWMKDSHEFLDKEVMNIRGFGSEKEGKNIFYIAPETGAEIMGVRLDRMRNLVEKNKDQGRNLNRKLNPVIVNYSLQFDSKDLRTENVAGMIRGCTIPGEVIVISSHYDHLGKRGNEIYHGADDDGSGTAAVLDLAKIFSIALRQGMIPKRSLLFLTFTGEEEGLFGSEYYSLDPLVPLDSTVADFNIDMIGRVDRKHEGHPGYVYLIGADKISGELNELSENCNATFAHLSLDYTYNQDDDPNRFYYRSDHYNFAKNDIPVIFYFTGVHPDYHMPTDTADKIDYDKMTVIVNLIFHTAWEVSNLDHRLIIK